VRGNRERKYDYMVYQCILQEASTFEVSHYDVVLDCELQNQVFKILGYIRSIQDLTVL
jgi:hypothetical protein